MDYQLYDFTELEKIPKDAMRTLSVLQENFARNLSEEISGQLRAVAEVLLDEIEQIPYSKFISKIDPPACMVVFTLAPLEGRALLDIGLNVAFSIIDRLLGGVGSTIDEKRELTEIEQTILIKTIDKILYAFKTSWAAVTKIEPKMISQETNPQLAQVVSPEDLVMVLRFKIVIGEKSGQMQFGIPISMLMPIVSKLNVQQWFSVAQDSAVIPKDNSATIKKSIQDAKIKVKVRVPAKRLSLTEILKLKEGQIIPMPLGYDDNAKVFIKNKIKFSGTLGLIGNKKGVKITRVEEGGSNNG